MACRKNSIDNEQDNIMYFATFVVYLPPKRTNKRVDSKTIFKPIKILRAYEKLFTLVFAACASLSVSAVEKDLVTTPITIEATQGEDGLKWAETEAIILEASDVAVNDFLKLTVTDAEAGSGEQNVLQFKKQIAVICIMEVHLILLQTQLSRYQLQRKFWHR